MPVLLLSFELSQKDIGSRLEIENHLGIFSSFMRIGDMIWLIETELSPGQVLNRFGEFYDSDDNVFVFRLESDWEASASFDQLTWLENRL
ncbi:hypothetical protein KJ966_01635 [bacterium]|nr:hypothetical protein [bacterium]